jgi:hypothetical protein
MKGLFQLGMLGLVRMTWLGLPDKGWAEEEGLKSDAPSEQRCEDIPLSNKSAGR